MTSFLSHIHADLRRARLTRRGATHQAEDVPKGVHKEYPRMPRIPLPAPAALDTKLSDILKRRRSAGFSGNPDIPTTLQELGTLLGLSLRARENAHRNYPSGGGLYPIETYLISTQIESETPAVFHYNPSIHALEKLWGLPSRFNIKDIAKHPNSLPLSTLIVFTSVWKRSSAKYGDLSYLHALLEAGHMSENLLLVGCALGLDVRPYAGFDDAVVARLLDLDEEEEQAVHSITLCKGGGIQESNTVHED
ncbi:MAG: nitroreductase [Parcubacteria group bacterium Athens0416_74]|nr:MAG: nitroreductase [Parcubacteria group bacterium Athens0416_74]